MAYSSSQAGGPIGAAAAGLHHSHSHAGSELHSGLTLLAGHRQILNPLGGHRDRTFILMASRFFFFFFFLAFFIAGAQPKPIEVPRLGVESELQLPAYTNARLEPHL